MKLFRNIMLCSVFLVWSLPSNAAWFYGQNIQYLYAGEIGDRYAIKVTGAQPNPGSCAVSFDLVIEPDNTKLKPMWAMLLAAYMANKPVNIHINGCSTGTNKLPVITDISIGSP